MGEGWEAMATAVGTGLGAGSALHGQCPQALRCAPQQQLGRAKRMRVSGRARAVVELAEASQSIQAAPDLTWQIWAGAIGGLSTFLALNCRACLPLLLSKYQFLIHADAPFFLELPGYGRELVEGLCIRVGISELGMFPIV